MKLLKASNAKVKRVDFYGKFLGGPSFSLRTGVFSSMKFLEKDIAHVAEISEDNYRSAGGAAVGAIVGGVLTGGVGLLLGGAFGGRKKYASIFAVKFKDNTAIVLQTESKGESKELRTLAAIHMLETKG